MKKTAAAILACSIFTAPVAHAADPEVEVAGGKLVGSTVPGGVVNSFKGIPFALPPVGALRWRPPQPLGRWQGIREAIHFAPACMQIIPQDGSFYQHEFFRTAEPQSEDCLYLNVWAAPAGSDAPRPVMVWFFGGGFNQGSGSLASFDGTNLARRGAVVVTINYRVGAFGFLAHPDLDAESPSHVSGNYGPLDQLAALRWVNENISSFGGDPARVTIFGQSAGALSVGYQMASPLAKGLFLRAIADSDPMFGMAGPTNTLAQAEDGGKRLLAALAAPSVAALRDMPASELMARVGTKYLDYALRPNIDGWFLPRDIPEVVAAGQENDADLLLGTNADEGTELLGTTTPDGLKSLIEQRFGAQAPALSALFHGDEAASATAAQDQLQSDYLAATARLEASLSARHGHPAWVYRFNRAAPGSDPVKVGAFHSAELVYVFGTQDSVDRPWTPFDRTLSDVMSAYWVQFAATGNPNAANLPNWPAFGEDETGPVMRFGTRPPAVEDLDAKAAPLFDAYLRTRLKLP